MKTSILFLAFISSVFVTQAQNTTCITAQNSEISDNLDLRVIASIFGEAKNLQDFEYQLNDPQIQISNLDLNNDNRVDYLRVIESVENNTHVVVIQSVLGQDLYQDVATIEVERNNYNKVYVQVIGNTFLYGHNYIYEPIYHTTPYIYASFWTSYYRPYRSTWTWNYYPTHYYAWNAYPVYRYRHHVSAHINIHNNYQYVNYRRNHNAVVIYGNGYEKQHPNQAFSKKNPNVVNRYEYDKTRNYRANSSSVIARNNYAKVATTPQRSYSQNRLTSTKSNTPQQKTTTQNYLKNTFTVKKTSTSHRTTTNRDSNQSRKTYAADDRSSGRRTSSRT